RRPRECRCRKASSQDEKHPSHTEILPPRSSAQGGRIAVSSDELAASAASRLRRSHHLPSSAVFAGVGERGRCNRPAPRATVGRGFFSIPGPEEKPRPAFPLVANDRAPETPTRPV